MKKLFLILLSTFMLFAQDDRLDELPFEDEDLQEMKSPYFAVAGGYTFNVGLMNFDEVNTLFSNFNFSDNVKFNEISNQLIMHGGGGFTAIPFWKNIRIGFEAFGGSAITDEITGTIGTDPVDGPIEGTRMAELDLSYTAMLVDYGYVLTDGLAVLGGLKIGASSMEMNISENPSSYNWNDFNSNGAYNLLQLKRDWLYVTPQISIEWAATEFLMIGGKISYNISFDNPLISSDENGWIANRSVQVDNSPNGLSTNGFNARFGIYLGLFNY